MELVALIILILVILNIYEKCSDSYFDIPTVDEYLEQNPQCMQKTETFEHSFQKHLNSVYTFI